MKRSGERTRLTWLRFSILRRRVLKPDNVNLLPVDEWIGSTGFTWTEWAMVSPSPSGWRRRPDRRWTRRARSSGYC
ncbi:MAG: hypothetical protein KGI89_11705 [Euryarchaeota archaeon]|nr:hypothetical protein [Euryarchaeota archaeon]